MRFFRLNMSALAIVVIAAVISGCGKQAETASSTSSAWPTHDATYYGQHADEARARDVGCNKAQLANEKLSTVQLADCDVARQAAHEANNAVYVPGKGKAFSSAGGSN